MPVSRADHAAGRLEGHLWRVALRVAGTHAGISHLSICLHLRGLIFFFFCKFTTMALNML